MPTREAIESHLLSPEYLAELEALLDQADPCCVTILPEVIERAEAKIIKDLEALCAAAKS